MNKNKAAKLLNLTFILFFTCTVFAQDETGFPDDTDDEGPINSYIVPMLIAGIAAGYVVLRKRQKAI